MVSCWKHRKEQHPELNALIIFHVNTRIGFISSTSTTITTTAACISNNDNGDDDYYDDDDGAE